MTKTGNVQQHRNITITVVSLIAVALAFFLAAFVQTQR